MIYISEKIMCIIKRGSALYIGTAKVPIIDVLGYDG